MEEAQTILISTSFYFSTLLQLLHIPNMTIINRTVLLLSRICENNQKTADIIVQCFLDENTNSTMSNSTLSLTVLICLLQEEIDITMKMNIVKFLAVLIYSAQSLASRVKVGVIRGLHVDY